MHSYGIFNIKQREIANARQNVAGNNEFICTRSIKATYYKYFEGNLKSN
jgi:hypothetical protein